MPNSHLVKKAEALKKHVVFLVQALLVDLRLGRLWQISRRMGKRMSFEDEKRSWCVMWTSLRMLYYWYWPSLQVLAALMYIEAFRKEEFIFTTYLIFT